MHHRLWVFFFVCAGANAAPVDGAGDELTQLLADRGLLSQVGPRIEQVRQTMSDTTTGLVINAMGFLGVPYRRGGNSVEGGFDCSGFVRAIYEQTMGLVLPRRAEQQAAATLSVEREDIQPGDLVFFNTMRRAFSHVGIYVGDGKFIHSPKPGAKVRMEDMRTGYWERRFNGVRRVATSPAESVAASAQ